ncbi:MAG: hypothetical protein KC912_18340 [Proteobacteria bacterium]|nr:hypothetical protein [Pseudomonadota bacterium]
MTEFTFHKAGVDPRNPIEVALGELEVLLRRIPDPRMAGIKAVQAYQELQDDYQYEPWLFSDDHLRRMRAIPEHLEALALLAHAREELPRVRSVTAASELLTELEAVRPRLAGSQCEMLSIHIARELVRRGSALMRQAS